MVKLARPPISPKIVSALAALINENAEVRVEGIDWQVLTPLLTMHALASRFFRRAASTGQALSLPRPILNIIYREQLRAEQMHALCETYVPSLLEGLESRGVKTVFLKGWALALRFYADPLERGFDDIDLLFESSDRAKVTAYFLEHGYKAMEAEATWNANAHKIEFVLNRDPNVKVECHFATGYGRYSIAGAVSRSRVEQLKLAGRRSISVRVLCPEDEYLYLIFHAAVQHRFRKLVWLLDLARFQKRMGENLNRKILLERAREHGLERALDMSEYFIERFLRSQAVVVRPDLDRWFERIASGALEFSAVFRARLRARLQGGWPKFARYAVQRTIAGFVR